MSEPYEGDEDEILQFIDSDMVVCLLQEKD